MPRRIRTMPRQGDGSLAYNPNPGSGCGKIRYGSRKFARAAMKRLERSGKDYHEKSGMVLVTYFCPSCEAWHVGHEARRIFPRARPTEGTSHAGPD